MGWPQLSVFSYSEIHVLFVIMSGIVFLAMPLAIVGNNFAKTFEERSLVKLQSLIRHLLLQNGISAADVVIELALDRGYGLSLVPTPWGKFGTTEKVPSIQRLQGEALGGGRGRGDA